MLVYVTTPKLIHQAFQDWIEQTGDDERRIIQRVFQAFMATPPARSFHSITGLISFPYPQWQGAFNQWRDQEIRNHPEHQEKIRYYTNKLCAHLQSDWALQHKLIVQECLIEDDIIQQVDEDLFDALV